MSLSDAAAEMSHSYWRTRTAEQRAAHGRKMRLGIVLKELGRHDLDPEIRERMVTTPAPAGDLGPGECELCKAQVAHLFYGADVDKVCTVCLGGGRDAA
jgi:hypothetical protein